MGQRTGLEQLLQEQAGRIASRSSYIAEFAFHDEFHPERTEDGGVVDGDDYGLLLHDPEGSSEETGVYRDAGAEDKDAELKATLAKAADLEKALQERDRTIDRGRCGTLLEAQHLEESFSSKCCFL